MKMFNVRLVAQFCEHIHTNTGTYIFKGRILYCVNISLFKIRLKSVKIARVDRTQEAPFLHPLPPAT
jgi:hypothetical protein